MSDEMFENVEAVFSSSSLPALPELPELPELQTLRSLLPPKSQLADILYGPTVALLVLLGYAVGRELFGGFGSLSLGLGGGLLLVSLLAARSLWTTRHTVLYDCVRAFNRVVANLYFREIHIAGDPSGVPHDGPVILIGNHQNQFLDGLLLTALSARRVRLLTAAKSLDRPIVGPFARGMGVIPVVRPKDAKFPGAGGILLEADRSTLTGIDAEFTAQLAPGSTVVAEAWSGVIESVVDDNTAVLKSVKIKTKGEEEEEGVQVDESSLHHPGPYSVVPKLDHSSMFSAVFEKLADGDVVGLFPEGGSHDNTHLLPLKAGVAYMALGAVDKFADLKVTIVPIGFNYHSGHRFRAKCVINYGNPLVIDSSSLPAFRSNKRAAVADLLSQVESSLRAVTINVPDEEFLDFVLTTKRLYTPSNLELTPEQNLVLTQRFAEGLQRPGILDRPDIAAIRRGVEEYARVCRKHGYNPFSATVVEARSLYGIRIVPLFLWVLLIALVAAIPGLILNVPVGLTARWLANRHAAKAVRESSVKVKGRDVISSYKLIVAFVALPVWFFTLSMGLLIFSPLRWTMVLLISASMPLFSYLGVVFTEQGIFWSKKLYPLLLRMLPSYRREEQELALLRSQLVADIRAMVESLGGDIAEQDRVVKREHLAADTPSNP